MCYMLTEQPLSSFLDIFWVVETLPLWAMTTLLFLPFLASIYSLIWSCFPWSADCFMDIVVGFDTSTHRPGQLLFHGHPRLESYLPDILEDITSIRGVSCGAGAETHVNVAFKVNSDKEFPAKFQIYQEPVFHSLLPVTVNGPTHLNAQFLQQLWDTFEDKSASRGQVSMSHSICHLCLLSCFSLLIIYFIFMSSYSLLSSFSRCYSSFQMVSGVKASQCLKINQTGSEKQVPTELKI